MDVIKGNLYDYPKYYDLIFGSDWKAEFDFLKSGFQVYAKKTPKRLFEPGCGTGRLMVKFGNAGFHVAGNDLNPHAVEFCNARLERHGLKPTAVVGDMSQFQLKKKVDAAFNMINTVRHLPSDEALEQHLECVAAALNPGGVYFLGLHLTPKTTQRCTEERWSATRGKLTVNSCLWSKDINLKKRVERIGMTFDVITPARQFRIEDETVFRTFTAEQMAYLILSVPKLELLATHDFRYDIATPIEIDDATEDVVYVLRRR